MVRRKGRKPTFQIRVDIDTKNKLDSLRGNLSYNEYLYHCLSDDKKLLDRYRLITKMLSKVEENFYAFTWEFDKLQENVEKERQSMYPKKQDIPHK